MYESGENYLETILVLGNRNGNVRSIDVARELNFSKPSVSRAMSILKEDGYIEIDTNGSILLTDKGRKKANSIYERHKLLTKFLIDVAKVSEELAEEDACKMEHIISEEVFSGIKEFMKK
ncbi:MAG TPA: metal-dependent transcriptional regulator [Candidatus Merdenecus merdavium]|nr:metal-dependent transcriptional regulator [Candidatus Merdenecus merdavium]